METKQQKTPFLREEEVKTLPRVDGGQASDAAARADETRTDLRRPIEGEVSEEKRLKSDDAMLSELMGSQAAASSGTSNPWLLHWASRVVLIIHHLRTARC